MPHPESCESEAESESETENVDQMDKDKASERMPAIAVLQKFMKNP